MQLPGPLLPAISSRADYEVVQRDNNVWFPAIQVICQRHGLSTSNIERQSDGTNVIFTVSENYIVKLYPPYWTYSFEAERTVAEYVHDKLDILTPEIYAYGTIEEWPYVIMQRLSGIYLVDIWDTLELTSRRRIITELAELVARLHALSTDKLPLRGSDWPGFIEERIGTCVQRHREQNVPEQWLQQIPAYLASAAPLYPDRFAPAIVSGDIHQYHLLVQQEHGRWRLCGLFDFDDSLIGFREYDLAAAGLFLMAGHPSLLRTFLLAYGYPQTAMNEQLSHRLLAYTLLHRYRPLNWIRQAFAKRQCTTLEELARTIYALE